MKSSSGKEASDESSAAAYHSLGNGDYTLTDSDGTVTERTTDGHLVQQTSSHGQVTNFQYRGDNYVATTGDDHVLFDGSGHEVKQWQGNDESSAAAYHSLGNGDYTLTDPDGTVTERTTDGHLVQQTSHGHGQVTNFQYRGDNYVATTGDDHVLFDGGGHEVKQWQGNDESSAAAYHSLGNGDYTLTDPDGTATERTIDGHLVQQISHGQVTNFQYRGDNYVATTGDDHVLFDSAGHEVKQWQGNDESSAAAYHSLGNGDYTLTDPDGTVTERTTDGHLVQQTSHGQVTNFQYRGDNYVATTGDDHVLFDSAGHEVKQWQGNDESSAAAYHSLGNGDYTLTDPDGTVTERTTDGHLVQQTSHGQVTNFQYRGDNYVATTGDDHVLFDSAGHEVKQWQGNDESSAAAYHSLGNGDYTLTDPDGTVTERTTDGHLVQQTSHGQVTNFQYRGDGYVATTGDDHVLYDNNGNEIKQWQGSDESKAALYHSTGKGQYTLTDPDGTVTEYADNHAIRMTTAKGQVTTYQYRGDGYVTTTGDDHVLYDNNGNEIKQWQGGDESKAALYHSTGKGQYTLTDPDGTVTEYVDNRAIRTTGPNGVTTYEYRGDGYVATTGIDHVLYDNNGNEIKEWKGNNESSAALYKSLGNGHYTLTDPDKTVTEYNENNKPVRVDKPGQPTQTIQWLPNGDSIVTQGDQHFKYDGKGALLESWTGNNESVADHYTYNDNGDLVVTGSDGSTTTYGPDGRPITTVLNDKDKTHIDWATDLPKLNAAVGAVQKERDGMELAIQYVTGIFRSVEDSWKSPAGDSFVALSTDFFKATGSLLGMLDEAVVRMRSSYQNYVESEAKNASFFAQINAEGQKAHGHLGGAG
ncbi:RHS repeat domain-containing protein [Fodinicola feengrottensis]|nr:hypothetical protein [Fodinicola feengrottensis]